MIMFSKTVTIEKFAVLNGIGEIKLIKNPNTGKNFVVADTGQSFKVSNKITSDDDLNGDISVSLITPEDGEEPFFMIHPTGAGSDANVVAKRTFGKAPIANPALVMEQGLNG
jgi:hypothetical protein